MTKSQNQENEMNQTMILQKNENSNAISWKLWYHNAWRSLLILQRKMKIKMGMNKRKLLWGNMNDLEHFFLLEYQKSDWDKKQDISNMQINEFQSHLFPLRFVMPKNFISISYKSFSNKNKKCMFWPWWFLSSVFPCWPKGQLISKCLFGVIVWTKKLMKPF